MSFYIALLVSATATSSVAVLPVLQVINNHLCRLFRRVLSPQCLYEIALWVHQVKVYAVVNQVILAGLHISRRAEVHPILLAQILDLVICSRQANKLGVELGEVALERRGVVAGRIARHKDGQKLVVGDLGIDNVQHAGHLVEFFGADVGAASESKIDLAELDYLS